MSPIGSPMGGPTLVVCLKKMHICTLVGDLLRPRCDCRKYLHGLDYFLLMFPPGQLTVIITLTSKQLLSIGKPATTAGESLKFFGVLALITQFEPDHIDDLRSSHVDAC
jgi:hypothetical protein